MDLDDLIELGDPDGLLGEIDRLCSRRDWFALSELCERCHLAVQRGKQLWGVAAHAEYRIALEAPVEFAVSVVDAQPSPFTIAPLTEVVASRFIWEEMSPLLDRGPLYATVAYERVVRGEDLSGDPSLRDAYTTFELPLLPAAWEPVHVLPTFGSVSADSPRPLPHIVDVYTTHEVEFTSVGERETTDALSALVNTWVEQSNGVAATCAVEGGLDEVVSALHWSGTEARRVSFGDAVAAMVWAGASGGVEGRRSGLAAGRSKAWWALAHLAGVGDMWPTDPGDICADLEWWTWGSSDVDDVELAVAAVDPVDGLAFGLFAVDAEA